MSTRIENTNAFCNIVIQVLFLKMLFLSVKWYCIVPNLVGNRKYMFSYNVDHMSLVVRKPAFGVSDQGRHKPGCTVTENG